MTQNWIATHQLRTTVYKDYSVNKLDTLPMLLPVPEERFQFESVTALLMIHNFMVRDCTSDLCFAVMDKEM